MDDDYLAFKPVEIHAENPAELLLVLNEYFRVISSNLDRLNGDQYQFRKLQSEPYHKYDGLTVFADGTNWNPGSGQGIYTYYASAWNKLG